MGRTDAKRLRELYLVRHGETEGESSIRYHGSNDVPLSDSGREQMLAARRWLPRSGFDAVISSPLSRAYEGARIAAPDAPVSVEERFREIDFGRWEGLTRDEIRDRDPELFAAWNRDRERFDFPEGEPRAEFRARIDAGLDGLLELEAERVLVVVHMGVVRSIVRRLCGQELESGVPALGQVMHVSIQAIQAIQATRAIEPLEASHSPAWRLTAHPPHRS